MIFFFWNVNQTITDQEETRQVDITWLKDETMLHFLGRFLDNCQARLPSINKGTTRTLRS